MKSYSNTSRHRHGLYRLPVQQHYNKNLQDGHHDGPTPRYCFFLLRRIAPRCCCCFRERNVLLMGFVIQWQLVLWRKIETRTLYRTMAMAFEKPSFDSASIVWNLGGCGVVNKTKQNHWWTPLHTLFFCVSVNTLLYAGPLYVANSSKSPSVWARPNRNNNMARKLGCSRPSERLSPIGGIDWKRHKIFCCLVARE